MAEKTQKNSWFKGLRTEFRKIVWPDRDMIIKQTIAVVLASVALGAIIKVLDTFIMTGVNFIV